MIILPAVLESYKSLVDKSYKVTLATGELSPAQAGDLAAYLQKFGWMAFKEDRYREKETEILQSLQSDFEDKGKSKAQRLRAVLYRSWENDCEGYEVFDDFYNNKMEKLIMHFKNKLP